MRSISRRKFIKGCLEALLLSPLFRLIPYSCDRGFYVYAPYIPIMSAPEVYYNLPPVAKVIANLSLFPTDELNELGRWLKRHPNEGFIVVDGEFYRTDDEDE